MPLNLLILLLGVLCGGGYSVGLKPANMRCRTRAGVSLFNAGSTLVAALAAMGMCAVRGTFAIPGEGILFAVCFGMVFSVTVFLNLVALEYGPLSLTNLLINFSLVMPLGYSFLFLDEAITPFRIIGILLFAVCMVLFARPGAGQAKEERKASVTWFILTLLSMITNGMLSIIQKMYAIRSDNQYSSPFLMYAYLFATVASVVIAVILYVCRRKQTVSDPVAVEGEPISKRLPALICLVLPVGLANFALNLVIVWLATRMDASIVYPVIQGGIPIVVAVSSRLIFREKITARKVAAILLGCLGIVLLNL